MTAKLKLEDRWKYRPRPKHLAALAPPIAPEAAASPPFQISPYDQARINKWICDRLTADWPYGCWFCRRPFVVGQKFIDVRGAGEVVVRFHASCEPEWRREREIAARRALGMPAPTKETVAL